VFWRNHYDIEVFCELWMLGGGALAQKLNFIIREWNNLEHCYINKKSNRMSWIVCFFFFWRSSPHWARASSLTRFLEHIQRRTTVGRNPVDEWSARRRDLYLTAYNTHNRKTYMPLARFEPTISTGERPQTLTLDREATGTGMSWITFYISCFLRRTCLGTTEVNLWKSTNYFFNMDCSCAS
jgi:hypothetical protein